MRLLLSRGADPQQKTVNETSAIDTAEEMVRPRRMEREAACHGEPRARLTAHHEEDEPRADAQRCKRCELARTHTYAANVWDLSIVQGPFSVAPCQTLTLRFATFSIAVRQADGRRAGVTSQADPQVLTLLMSSVVTRQADLALRESATRQAANERIIGTEFERQMEVLQVELNALKANNTDKVSRPGLARRVAVKGVSEQGCGTSRAAQGVPWPLSLALKESMRASTGLREGAGCRWGRCERRTTSC